MITTVGRPTVLAVADPTIAGEVRRAATVLASRLGFEETRRGQVAIVATEAATNLDKHASGGEIVIQGLTDGTLGGIDILTLDGGPGMADVSRCLADGFSTAGSPGTGLGAISRLSAVFDIHSLVGVGSVTLARLWALPRSESRWPVVHEFGAVSVPVFGEDVCGDAWAIDESDGRITILVADGLGHGPHAAEAAQEAVRIFAETSTLDPAERLSARRTQPV